MPALFDLPTTGFLLIVGFLMPLGAWHGYRKLKRGEPLLPKLHRFRSMLLVQIALPFWALLAADSNDIHLSYRASLLHVAMGISIAILLLAAVARGWHKLEPARRERVLLLYGPENATQFYWLVAGGIAAGIGEEIVYRGVLFAMLSRFTSGVAAATIVCLIFFALAHATQGVKSMLAVGYLGLIFHLCCFLTGSLFTAMTIHTIYDLGMFVRLYREHRTVAMDVHVQPESALKAGSEP